MTSEITYYNSPIGVIEIAGTELGISSVLFVEELKTHSSPGTPVLKECLYQLDEYFKGIRKDFGLKLNPSGSDFQKKVWEELLKIPFGKTASYADIARELGESNASRAVGKANSNNPLCIIIPCHRVIGSTGKLTGYNGGLWRKEWLLNYEKELVFGRQITMF